MTLVLLMNLGFAAGNAGGATTVPSPIPALTAGQGNL